MTIHGVAPNMIPPETPMDPFRIGPLIKTMWKVSSSLIGMHRERDIAIFHKLDSILDESRVKSIFDYSFFTECLRFEERELLYKFGDALQRVENQYLHPVIQVRATALARELSQLLRTVGAMFRSDDGEIYRFQPDPIDPTAYDRELDKLHDQVEKTSKAYRTYRQAVKKRLHV